MLPLLVAITANCQNSNAGSENGRDSRKVDNTKGALADQKDLSIPQDPKKAKAQIEKADEPTNVMGAMLTCVELKPPQNDPDNIYIGCRLHDKKKNKIQLRDLNSAARWEIRTPQNVALGGRIYEDKQNKSYWNMVTVVPAKTNHETVLKNVRSSKFAAAVPEGKSPTAQPTIPQAGTPEAMYSSADYFEPVIEEYPDSGYYDDPTMSGDPIAEDPTYGDPSDDTPEWSDPGNYDPDPGFNYDPGESGGSGDY